VDVTEGRVSVRRGGQEEVYVDAGGRWSSDEGLATLETSGREAVAQQVRAWTERAPAGEGPEEIAAQVAPAERMNAAEWDNVLVTRFVIRATAFGRSIRRTDRIFHEGITYGIDGIKEVPDNRGFLEITAQTDDIA